jgi:hypothetical protein
MRWWNRTGGSGRRVEGWAIAARGNRRAWIPPLSTGCLPPVQATTGEPVPVKRASPSSRSPLFSSQDRWSLDETPVQPSATDTVPKPSATVSVPTANDHEATHEPPPGESPVPEESRPPVNNHWASMPESAWNTCLVLALTCAEPLVWGGHQGAVDTETSASNMQPLALEQTPPLFKKVGDLKNIAARVESVLLSAASDPVHFARTLDSLVGPAMQLIGHPQLDGAQASRLLRLPMTALAIAYQQGLTRDVQQIKSLAALAIQYKDQLWGDEYWVLLRDLETALQGHGEEHDQLHATLRQTREALEHKAPVSDHIPRDPRTMTGASLQEKEACLKALVNQTPPCGPLFIAQWSWVAKHWNEPELRGCILEGVSQWMLEASKGVSGNKPFQGAFLFDLFPIDVLTKAFDLTGSPDNAKLLQVRPLTEQRRALLNHYLQNKGVAETDRQRMRNWHLSI